MTKSTLNLTLLCLLFTGSSLFSQGSYYANPSNIFSIASDISSNYSAGIAINVEKIANHIAGLLPDHSSSCAPPEVKFDGQSGDNLSFNWESAGSEIDYKLTYLNLQNGASKSLNLSQNDATFSNLPDGMYLISLVSLCGAAGPDGDGTGSSAHIIIMDKPVMLIFDPYVDCPCDKLATEFYINRSAQSGPVVDIPWTPQDEIDYFVKLGYTNGGTASSIRITPQKLENPPGAFNFILRCMANFNFGYGLNANTFFGPGNSDLLSLYLNPADYDWILTDNLYLVKNIWLLRCDDKIGPGRTEIARLASTTDSSFPQIFPNPANDFVTITMPLSAQQQKTRLSVINEMGQLMHVKEITEDGQELIIDINNWPLGVYNAIFTNSGISQHRTFVKAK